MSALLNEMSKFPEWASVDDPFEIIEQVKYWIETYPNDYITPDLIEILEFISVDDPYEMIEVITGLFSKHSNEA